MRTVIIGASRIGRAVARKLIARGEDLVVVDRSREKLEQLGEKLDCGMLAGDGTDPDTLREARGEKCDILLALTAEDQDNILACLLGKSIGYDRAIPRISNTQLFALCDEMGLRERLSPEEDVSRSLVERLYEDAEESSDTLPWPARLFTIRITEEDKPNTIADLDIPKNARPVCIYRDSSILMASRDEALTVGDQIAIVADDDALQILQDRYHV